MDISTSTTLPRLLRGMPFFLFLAFAPSLLAAPVFSVEQPAGTAMGVSVWGWNMENQQVIPDFGTSSVRKAVAGGLHCAALLSEGNGKVVCWGDDRFGKLTTPVSAQSGVSEVAAGGEFTVALKNGEVIVWGLASYGITTVPTAAQSGVTAIAAGGLHVLALKNGGVIAWGESSDNKTVVPTAAQSGVIAIGAGSNFSVALKSDGTVVAWGSNTDGQVSGAAGVTGVTDISVEFLHVLALKDGGVTAWGSNSHLQSDVPAAALSGIVKVEAGAIHSMALKDDGTVVYWGSDGFGQISPPVGSRTNILSVSGGTYHTVALKGGVFGRQLLETTSAEKTFTIRNPSGTAQPILNVFVSGGNAADFTVDKTAMAASVPANGGTTTFTLKFAPGAAGSRNTTLRVQYGSSVYYDVQITGIGETPVPDIAVSPTGAAADFGDVGVGFDSQAKTFTVTNNGTGAIVISGVSVTGGDAADFTLDTTGMLTSVPAFGGQTTFTVTLKPAVLGARATTLRILSNDPDQATFDIPLTGTGVPPSPEIGAEDSAGSPIGVIVGWGAVLAGSETLPSGATVVAAGSQHGLALRDGRAYAWGDNFYGQLNVPTEALSGVTAIAAGSSHNLAVVGGRVYAWGYNGGGSGQTTVPVDAQSNVVAVAAGVFHSMALRSDGRVVAWGSDFAGQATVPTAALTGVTAIAAGDNFCLAIKNGAVIAWGQNDRAQTEPPAAALSGVVAVEGGNYHALALKADGSIVAWGALGRVNQIDYGQANVPAAALFGMSGISASHIYSFGLKADGTVLGWGYSGVGSLATIPDAAKNGVVSVSTGLSHGISLKGVPFGLQGTGVESAAREVRIRNTGTSPLAVSGVSVIDGNSADFSVDTTGMLASVPAGGETSFMVSFTPGALGLRNATLRILSDDADEAKYDIVMTGTGIVPLSTNADLASLTPDTGTLSPVFDADTLGYAVSVPNTVASISITPTVDDASATVTVNGTATASGATSAAIPLLVGETVVPVLVTAEDGITVKAYSITVTRQSAFFTWATINGVSTDPTANGGANLLLFAFGLPSGGGGALEYTGTFAGSGAVTRTGEPVAVFENITGGVDFRALFVRRKDHSSVGLTYTPQFSGDLVTWQDGTVVPTVLADDGAHEVVSVPYPFFVNGKKARYFRIAVSLAP